MPAPGERISTASFGDDGIFFVCDSNVPSTAERTFSVATVCDGAISDDNGGAGSSTDDTGDGGAITNDTGGGGGPIPDDTNGGGPITDDTGGGGASTDDTGGGGASTDDTGGGGPITDDTGGGGAMVDKSVSTTSGRRSGGDEGRGGTDGDVSAAVAVSLRRICAKLIRGLGS